MNRYVQALVESMPHRATGRHGHKPGLTTDPGGHGPVGGRVTTTRPSTTTGGNGNGNGNGNGTKAADVTISRIKKRRTTPATRPPAEKQHDWTEYQRIGRILAEVGGTPTKAKREESPWDAAFARGAAARKETTLLTHGMSPEEKAALERKTRAKRDAARKQAGN